MSLRWGTPEAPDRAILSKAFATRAFHAHKGDAGRYRVLEATDAGRRVALLALRDIHVPGLYRRWAVLTEPEWLGPPADPADALAALVAHAASKGVDALDCRFNMARWPIGPVGAEVEPFGTYLVDLSGGVEAMRAGLSGNHRRIARKALEAGAVVGPLRDAGELVALMRSTYDRSGKALPFAPDYLRGWVEAPPVPCHALGVHGPDGALDACALVPYDRWRGYYLHGASRREGVPGAAVLALVAAMEALIADGVPAFDLGGARPDAQDPHLAGIARFKARFGGAWEPVARWSLERTPTARWAHRIAAAGERLRDRLSHLGRGRDGA